MTTPDDITIDTKHVGMINGRAVSAKISPGNEITFSGYEGASIMVLDPNYKSTGFKIGSASGGVYAIDNIPTGSYNVRGCGPSSIPLCDYESAVVSSQQSYKVSDLVVTIDKTIANRDKDAILYGTLFDTNNQPLPGKKLELWHNFDYKKEGETITSREGKFAFYIELDNANRYVRCSDGNIKIGNWPKDGYINFANVEDKEFNGPLLEMNAVLTPK